MAWFTIYSDDIDKVIDDLEDCNRWERKGPGLDETRHMKRWIFLLLSGLMAMWLFLVIAFVLIMISTPFWLESQNLPFHVAYPFDLHDPSKHPVCHAIIFISQSCIMLYAMAWTVVCEQMSVTIFSELTSALKALCMELRIVPKRCNGNATLLANEVYDLAKFHQRINGLGQLYNGSKIVYCFQSFFQHY